MLTAADGRDVFLSEASAGALASLGLTAGRQRGPLPGTRFRTAIACGSAKAGLTAGTQASVVVGPPELQLQNMSTPGEPPMDLSSHSGASDALEYLDGKLDEVSDIRAQLGAVKIA
jgi:flagellin